MELHVLINDFTHKLLSEPHGSHNGPYTRDLSFRFDKDGITLNGKPFVSSTDPIMRKNTFTESFTWHVDYNLLEASFNCLCDVDLGEDCFVFVYDKERKEFMFSQSC